MVWPSDQDLERRIGAAATGGGGVVEEAQAVEGDAARGGDFGMADDRRLAGAGRGIAAADRIAVLGAEDVTPTSIVRSSS